MSGFGLENLPYGVGRVRGGEPEVLTRIGDDVVRLVSLDPDLFAQPSLNTFIAAGSDAWKSTRTRVAGHVAAAERIPLSEVELLLPIEVGDYVDFFSSLEHATNAGRVFRPDDDPLSPNWRHLPIGYHGRSGTVVVSGTPVRRPSGQLGPGSYGPEPELDFELELGFLVGGGAGPIATADAADYVFGFVMLNDWSARAIQRWESRPLGPFLGKSFATSISAWVVPFEALAPFRVDSVEQDPPPLPHLAVDEPWALDLDLSVELDGEVVTRVNSRGLYWNVAQQLAHATSNGAPIRAGDLFATGTISGFEPGTQGCLLERGRDVRFLQDGDEVVLRGSGARDGVTVALGEVAGRVESSR